MAVPATQLLAFEVVTTLGGAELASEPRRRMRVWMAIACVVLVLQVAVYGTSTDKCSRVHIDVLHYWHRREYFAAFFVRDGVAPWATAAVLGCIWDHRGRFHEDSKIHVLSRRWTILCALCNLLWSASHVAYCQVHLYYNPWCPDGPDGPYMAATSRRNVLAFAAGDMMDIAAYVFYAFSVVVLCRLIVLKIQDTGFGRLAIFCNRLLITYVASLVILVFNEFARRLYWHFRENGSDETDEDVGIFVIDTLFLCIAMAAVLAYIGFVVVAVVGVLSAVRSATVGGFTEFSETAPRRALRWAQLLAAVTAVNGALTCGFGFRIARWFGCAPFDYKAFQFGLNVAYMLSHLVSCLQVVMLSALIGPSTLRQCSEEAFAEVGRLRGFALHDTRRITFTGRVTQCSQKCIVSFPGCYADLWTSVTNLRAHQASVACVFLPSVASGLGQHAPDPNHPNHPCYCSVIYPPFKPSDYLRIVPKPSDGLDTVEYPDRLAFARADAAAMSIHLLVEADYPSFLWQWVKKLGEREAFRICERNGRRAPWGCQWFADWVQNVEIAAGLRQEMLVFFKHGKVGSGKLPWKELTNPARVAAATETSGLGASQRVEVAYLESKGYRYTELDVMDFVSGDHFGDAAAESDAGDMDLDSRALCPFTGGPTETPSGT